IEELEAAIARDEEALHDPALYTRDPQKFAALTEAVAKSRAEKDAAEERWLELAEMVESNG
ncbi:MAG: ABC transporter ATP-binding protein, partial [Novosphingobium sp.]|nr:ABC transporter ATP-binding protein [Novosphingobium sp.]